MNIIAALTIGYLLGFVVAVFIHRVSIKHYRWMLKERENWSDYWRNQAFDVLHKWADAETRYAELLKKINNRDDSKDADWWKKGRNEN
jgi:hypothetical protein